VIVAKRHRSRKNQFRPKKWRRISGTPSDRPAHTDTGKARSAQNSYKHGFFARNLFHGGEPAGTEGQDTTELGEQIWEYYAPVGYMEELLVEKIVCESKEPSDCSEEAELGEV